MNLAQKKVVDYYTNPESKFGYDLVLWGTKHFGYYPDSNKNISEKQALEKMQDLIAQNLDLKPGQRVLDAGCGQGVVSTYLAKKYGANITGITIVPFEVERAKARAQNMSVADKVEYHLMDYSNTSFPDNHFDAIYTTETLSHSPDLKATLKELRRILKPSGKFAFFEYTLAPDSKFSPWELKMLDSVIEGSAMMGLKEFRHDDFPRVLESVGLKNVKEQNISRNIEPSFRRLHNLSILPYIIVKLFGLQRYFTNTTAGYEYYKMAKKDLFRYCIFTGNK